MQKLVAVYGSLLKGLGNHRLIEKSKLVGTGKVHAPFKMYSLGGFPAIVPSEEVDIEVVTEVYSVDTGTFERLDALEGYPSFYDRKVVPVKLDDTDEIVECWIYFQHEEPSYSYGLVEDNDWYKYINSRSE